MLPAGKKRSLRCAILFELRRSGLVFLRLSRCSLTKHLRKTLQRLYGRRLA
jgi:hypothetical protein